MRQARSRTTLIALRARRTGYRLARDILSFPPIRPPEPLHRPDPIELPESDWSFPRMIWMILLIVAAMWLLIALFVLFVFLVYAPLNTTWAR